MKLRPVTYNFIDFMKGEGLQHGFVAQELQKEFPDTVYTSEDYIPDIFKQVEIDGFTFRMENHNLTNNDKIQLITHQGTPLFVNVIKVESDVITIDLEKALYENVFVYGKYVKNHLNINYNHLVSYNIAHTQALYLKIQEQDIMIKNLQSEIQKVTLYLEKLTI